MTSPVKNKDNHNGDHTFLEKEVEEELEEARIQLTSIVLQKQMEVVLKMGQALEKIRRGERRAGICEEIKDRLREEITQGLISTRTIEVYCKPEWKNPAKSRSGRKGAESKKKLLLQSSLSAADPAAASAKSTEEQGENPDVKLEEEEEKKKEKTILIRTDGSDERPSAKTNDMDWMLREQELLERLREKDAIIIKQQEAAGLKEDAQYYKQKAEQSFSIEEIELREAEQKQQQQI